jgi:membrane fusion protein
MQNESNLYRQTAWEAQSMHRHGTVLLLPSFRTWLVSLGLIIWVVLMLVVLNTHSFIEKSTVTGFITSKQASIALMPKEGAGAIREVYVENGQKVKKGERLLTIVRPNTIVADKNSINNQLKALNEHIALLDNVKQTRIEDDAQQLQYLRAQQSFALQQKDALAEQATYLGQRIEIAQDQVTKFETLNKQHLLSLDSLNNATQSLLALRQQSAQIRQQISDNGISISRLNAQEAKLRKQNAHQRGETKLSQLPIERQVEDLQSEHTYTLYATRDGIVSNLHAQVGDDIARFPVLLKLAAPEQTLLLQLAVPTSAAGFIKKSQRIRVRLDAFPHQKYGSVDAQIESVANTVTLPNESQALTIAIQQPVFMVNASLQQQYIHAKGERIPLKEGMTVQADVMLSQRSLFEWLLSPLYSLRGSL